MGDNKPEMIRDIATIWRQSGQPSQKIVGRTSRQFEEFAHYGMRTKGYQGRRISPWCTGNSGWPTYQIIVFHEFSTPMYGYAMPHGHHTVDFHGCWSTYDLGPWSPTQHNYFAYCLSKWITSISPEKIVHFRPATSLEIRYGPLWLLYPTINFPFRGIPYDWPQ